MISKLLTLSELITGQSEMCYHIHLDYMSMIFQFPYVFLQNRMEIFKGHKDEMIEDGLVHRLVINKLSAKDAGMYMLDCDGTTTTATLFVKGR